MENHLVQIVLALIAIFAGITLSFKWVKKNSTKTSQKDNVVGGDMAGRDIKKK